MDKPSQANKEIKKSEAPKVKVAKSPRSGRLALVLSTLSFVLTLLVLIVIVYHWKQVSNSRFQSSQSSEQVSTQLQQNQEQLALLQNELIETKQLLKQQQTDISISSGGLKRVMNAQTHTRADWVLEEAAHLLRLANQTIQFNRNVSVAMTLLKASDKQLAHLSDPSLTPVRKASGEDLASLEAVKQVDLEGLLIKLTSLSEKVNQLPLKHTVNTQQDIVSEDKPNTQAQSKWKEALAQSLETIKTFIVIRKHEHGVLPLPSEEQHALLKQNLELMFSRAQWAASQQKDEIYKKSVEEINLWVKKFLGPSAQLTQALDELTHINVQPELPDISNSLKTLQKVMADRGEKDA